MIGSPGWAWVAVHRRAVELTAPTHPHPGTESAAKNLTLGPLAEIAQARADWMAGTRFGGGFALRTSRRDPPVTGQLAGGFAVGAQRTLHPGDDRLDYASNQ